MIPGVLSVKLSGVLTMTDIVKSSTSFFSGNGSLIRWNGASNSNEILSMIDVGSWYYTHFKVLKLKAVILAPSVLSSNLKLRVSQFSAT